jgi:hypothetical protein
MSNPDPSNNMSPLEPSALIEREVHQLIRDVRECLTRLAGPSNDQLAMAMAMAEVGGIFLHHAEIFRTAYNYHTTRHNELVAVIKDLRALQVLLTASLADQIKSVSSVNKANDQLSELRTQIIVLDNSVQVLIDQSKMQSSKRFIARIEKAKRKAKSFLGLARHSPARQ